MLIALESVAAVKKKMRKAEEELSQLRTAALKLREAAVTAWNRRTTPAGGGYHTQGSTSRRRERGQHGRLDRPTTTAPRAQNFSTALANFSSENNGEIVYSDLGLFNA